MLLIPLSRWRAAGLLIAIVTLVLIWLADYAGVFRLPDASVYREYHRLMPPIDQPPSQVLLVEGDLQTLEEDEWPLLIQQLKRFEPAAIGVMYPPPRVSKAGLDAARQQGVVIGEAHDQASSHASVITPAPSPWPEDVGLHQPHPRIGDDTFTSLEAAVANLAGQEEVAGEAFLIDFRPGINHLPLIRLDRVLKGDLTPDLINGRAVLIGQGIDSLNPPLQTPLSVKGEISRLMHAGYAVETLLQASSLHRITPWQNLLFWGVLIVAAILLYVFWGVSHALGIAIGGSLALFAAGWAALHFVGWIVPTSQLIAFHLLLWYLISRREQRRESSTVRQVLRTSSGYLQDRLLPTDFNTSDDPWGHVILLTTQLLNLEKAIVLERIPGRHHVREVKAYGCSIEDIDERRRDFERTPYASARLEGGPLLLNQAFLKNPAPDSRQFLVPLEFNGRVLGFFSGEVTKQTLDETPFFLSLLGDFSERIGELLYRRQRFQARQERESSEWARLLKLNSLKAEYQSLSDMALLLERRISLLEDVFDNLKTSTILYDAFGQVSQVNRRMKDLARRADLSIFSLTAADVLATLGDMPLSQARRHLQYLVQTDQPRVFAVDLPLAGSACLLNVRPLKAQALEEDAREESLKPGSSEREDTPLHFLGFLFELVDVSQVVWLERLKQDVSRMIDADLCQRIESSLQAARALPASDEASHLQAALESALQSSKQATQHHQSAADIHRLTDFPVNPETLLEETTRRWAPRLEAGGLELATGESAVDTLVRVDAGNVIEVLDDIMEVLAEDCIAGKKVMLDLEQQTHEGKSRVLLRLENQGYGMPDERFKALLEEDSGELPPAFQRLAQARRRVHEWGGKLQGHSALGQGLCIEIWLPALSLREELAKHQLTGSGRAEDDRDTD
ncbi:CHASE2 domain-containing protein [Halomonas alkaliantarctica]|nr:CHASE2 domain-containing protein [Halomonas alkaliantarctica]